jgi:hypothetical protein
MFVTQWFQVGSENPSKEKPGFYDVKFSWPGAPVLRIYFDGAAWGRVGKFKPNSSWGDKWRGLHESSK